MRSLPWTCMIPISHELLCSASLEAQVKEKRTHACAPSLSAMNGRSGHSLSTAGSVPSSAPNQPSTSGPLRYQLAEL